MVDTFAAGGGDSGGAWRWADAAAPLYGGLSPSLFERLRAHLDETVAVIDAEGRVRHRLGPPEGALGLAPLAGRHIFEYCAPEDLPYALELVVEALHSPPGWSATWRLPLRDANGIVRPYEINIVNRQDDPEIDGFVLRLRALPPAHEAPSNPLFASAIGRELESLAGAMPLPIMFIGSDARLYYLNESARELCGELVDRVLVEGISALAEGEDRRLLAGAVQELLQGAGERTVVFRAAPSGAARGRVLEAQISALGRSDRVLALVATLVDITARFETESELRRRASSDPLTGVLNRTEIEDCLRARLLEGAPPVGVCYVDLDGFKSVNDTHGHEVGDEFLVAIAKAIATALGPEERVGRFGGDEFVILSAASTEAELSALARRVAAAVAACAWERSFSVTASVGVGISLPGDTPRELLRRADHAMYEKKRLRHVGAASVQD